MPIYEYRCLSCGEKFEKLVRASSGAQPVTCPACQSEGVERQLSVFATVGSSPRENDSWASGSSCATGFCGL